MKSLFFFISLIIPTLISAQPAPEVFPDTIYLNSFWKESSKEEAEYYRTVSKHNDGYLVSDFYLKTDILYMTGVCSEIKPFVKNGRCTYFFKTGKKSLEGECIKDKMVGIWTLWEEDHTDSSTIECFVDGTYKNIHLSTSRATLYNKYNVRYKIEEPATFPGGEAKMVKWITRQIDKRGYPEKEKEAGISGTCYVTFVVEKDGRITDIKILQGVPKGPGYDQLVIELIKEMPLWKPAMQYGQLVRVQFNFPMRFALK